MALKEETVQRLLEVRALVKGIASPIISNHQQIVEDEGVLYFELNPKFSIISVNKQVCQLLGMTIQDLVGRSMSDLVSPEDFKKTIDALEEKGYVRKKVTLQGKDYLALILKNNKTNNYGEYLFLVE